MNLVVTVHVACAAALPLLELGAAWRGATPNGRRVAWAGGLVAIVAACTGLATQREFETHARHATYVVSHRAGRWLDDKQTLGVAACAFALALAITAVDRATVRRTYALLGTLSALFTLAAWAALAHARALAAAS